MADETAKKQPLIRAVVAPGRTVQDLDKKLRGPGSLIQLPRADVIRLRELGFLLPASKMPEAAPVAGSDEVDA